MNTMRCGLGVCTLIACLAPAAPAQQPQGNHRDREFEQGQAYDQGRADDRGYAAGYAAAIRELRRRGPDGAYDEQRGYVSQYTPLNPYAWQNRPRTSTPAAVSASRARTSIRGRTEYDDYLDYPYQADYHRRPDEDLPPRGEIYDPGDFRDAQGGIYGNRGVLMWTDRYDAGDYANKFWNTHRDNVYAGQRVWNTYNGDQ